jgi:hypothetical protein
MRLDNRMTMGIKAFPLRKRLLAAIDFQSDPSQAE